MAIEPRAYREAIGEVIGYLRPRFKVTIVESEDLVEELVRLDPELVICAQPEPVILDGRPAWVEYQPYAETAARVSFDGKHTEHQELGLEDLLCIADETEEHFRTNNDLKNG